MKACLVFSLGVLMLLPACARRSSAPVAAAPPARPEITIHAPRERVLISLIIQQKGEGSSLESQTGNRLTFVRRVSKPLLYVQTEVAPSGAPYVRTTYTLDTEAHDTRVAVVNSELINNYGTAAERVRPLDSPTLRRDRQRGLVRLRAVVERL